MSRTGGRPARRAIARWSVRLLRREWRQQALVVGLLTLVVATSIVFTAGTYNAASVSDTATLGSADRRYEGELAAPSDLAPIVVAAAARPEGVDIIASWSRPIPGLAERVEIRSADPAGHFSAGMLALVEGRFPSTNDEVGLTDDLGEVLGAGIGDRVDLDGRARTVVGVVENPDALASDFALVSPTDRHSAEVVAVLTGETVNPAQVVRSAGVNLSSVSITDRSRTTAAAAAAAMLGVTGIALLLVSLVAAAGFVALAQRRLRQLGVLASLGATESHLRRVVLANGAGVGVVSSVFGAVLGLSAWTAIAVGMEEAIGRRIDPTAYPWWTVAAPMGLTVLAATAAAWWPARVVARVPVTEALSGRPPRPQPVHRSATVAAGLLAAGFFGLGRAGTNPVLLIGGTMATAVGVLLASPLALRAAARLASRLPVAVRIATRDLARHQARAGTALAAVSLTLGIPVAIVVTSTAAEADRKLGNLSDRQVLVWTRDRAQPEGVSPYYTEDPEDDGFSPYLPRLDPGELDALAGDVARIADALGGATVAPLQLVTDRQARPTPEGRLSVTLALPAESGSLDVAPLFVASDRLLEAYGLDRDPGGSGPDFRSVPDLAARLPAKARDMLVSDELVLSNTAQWTAPAGEVATLTPSYSSLPGSLVSAEAAARRGWDPVVVGWLLDTSAPVTADDVGRAREIAVAAGLLVEPPERDPSLLSLRWGSTVAGLVVALGVLAATVGLLRRETERDLRTLTAAGATGRMRRTLSATTCGALALLGALLGTAGAYLALAAGHLSDLDHLTPVPLLNLLAIVLGTPLAAASASWLLAGGEPVTLNRPVMD